MKHTPSPSRLFVIPAQAGMFISALVLLLCLTTALSAATLVDDELRVSEVSLQSLDDQWVSYFDEQRHFQTRPASDFLQIRLAEGDAAAKVTADDKTPSPQAIVQLIDGQQLRGELVSSDDAGQVLVWRQPLVGELRVKLDHVRWLALDAKKAPAVSTSAPSTTDRLTLANGDRLEGFVSSVTDKAVTFQAAGVDQPITLERERVALIELANAPLPQERQASLLKLIDGSQVLVTQLRMQNAVATFRPVLATGEDSQSLELGQIQRVNLAHPRLRLVSWLDLPRTVEAGGQVFTAALGPYARDGSLHLHAPVKVMFTLPAGVQALAAWAVLDVVADDPAIAWADFVLTLQADDQAPQRVTLNVEHPRHRLRVAQPAQRLTIELDPALNGPLMDRLRLEDAWVVVEE